MTAAVTFGVGRLIAIQALNKGDTQADSQSVFVPRAITKSRMLRCWMSGDDVDGEREMLEREETDQRDGRMQVYQAVRLAFTQLAWIKFTYAQWLITLGEGERKPRQVPSLDGQNYPNKPKTPFPCKSRQGLSLSFLSAHWDNSIDSAPECLTSRAWPSKYPSHQPRNLIEGNTPRRRF